jgi:hypothetical protein
MNSSKSLGRATASLLTVALCAPAAAVAQPQPIFGGSVLAHHRELTFTIGSGGEASFELPVKQKPVRIEVSFLFSGSQDPPRVISGVVAQAATSGKMNWISIDNQGNVRASDPTSSAVIASFCSGPDCVATIANLEVDEAAGTLKIRQDPESLFPGVDGNFAVSLWY